MVLSWGFGLYVFQITLTVLDIDNDRIKDYGNWTPQSIHSLKSNHNYVKKLQGPFKHKTREENGFCKRTFQLFKSCSVDFFSSS